MIRPIFNITSGDLTKSSNYINKTGNNPRQFSIMNWNKLVFTREELNDKNWLYVGKDIDIIKQKKIWAIELDNGDIAIRE